MAASAELIARLRRLTGEPTTATYDDAALAERIEAYPVRDARGEDPYSWDASATPPAPVSNDAWLPTYDLYAAAADVWEEKAATVASDFDFSADGGRYDRSQVYEQYMKQVRYFRGKRRARGTRQRMEPRPGRDGTTWIGNLAEEE